MAEYLIQDTTLTNIADAIRAKEGTTDSISVNDIASRISAIETGELLIENSDEAELPTLSEKGRWEGIAYGNGKFVIVPSTYNEPDYLSYSDDGITWTKNTSLPNQTLYTVCFADGKFITMNSSNGTYISYDGINWDIYQKPSGGYGSYNKMVYGNGTFVWLSNGANSYAYSTDGGFTWVSSTTDNLGSGFAYASIAFGEGKFIMVSRYYSNVASSTDGINWSLHDNKASTITSGNCNWSCLTYGDGKFVAVNSESPYAVYSSDGGITWTLVQMPSSDAWSSVIYENDKFVAIASNSSSAAYSFDGITWVKSNLPSSSDWAHISYGDGKFVAISATSNDIAISKDGINWSTNYCTITYNDEDITGQMQEILTSNMVNKTLYDEAIALYNESISSWSGDLTFSGTYATSTYYTSAGCSLAVDKQKGMAFITIQGGTSSSYENIYFTAASLPSGVTLLTPPGGTTDNNFGTGGSTKCYYTAVLTGITGKINVAVAMGTRANTSYDAVNCALTVTYA